MGWMLNLRVTSGPSKTIPMTRSPSRLGTDTNLCPRVKVKQNSRLDKFSSQVPFHLTQRDSIHSRINLLVRPNRFFLQTLQTCYVEDCEFIQDIKSPLPLCHKSLHPCIKTSSSSTSVDRFSNKIRPVHGRCILIRLGHSNATIPIQGDFQGWSQVPSYQCKGTSDSLFRPSSNRRKRSTDSNKNRLSSGIECDDEKRFIVSSYVSNFSLNLEQNLFNTTNPSSVSHSRGYECENRPSVKTNSVVNRMVSTKVHFQALLLSVQDQSTSGFVYI